VSFGWTPAPVPRATVGHSYGVLERWASERLAMRGARCDRLGAQPSERRRQRSPLSQSLSQTQPHEPVFSPTGIAAETHGLGSLQANQSVPRRVGLRFTRERSLVRAQAVPISGRPGAPDTFNQSARLATGRRKRRPARPAVENRRSRALSLLTLWEGGGKGRSAPVGLCAADPRRSVGAWQ